VHREESGWVRCSRCSRTSPCCCVIVGQIQRRGQWEAAGDCEALTPRLRAHTSGQGRQQGAHTYCSVAECRTTWVYRLWEMYPRSPCDWVYHLWEMYPRLLCDFQVSLPQMIDRRVPIFSAAPVNRMQSSSRANSGSASGWGSKRQRCLCRKRFCVRQSRACLKV
jgi:hypothetical protein